MNDNILEDKRIKGIEYEILSQYYPLMSKLSLLFAKYIGSEIIDMKDKPKSRWHRNGFQTPKLCIYVEYKTFGSGESFGLLGIEYNTMNLSVYNNSIIDFYAEYYLIQTYCSAYAERKVKAVLDRRISLNESSENIEKWLVKNFVDYYTIFPDVLFPEGMVKYKNAATFNVECDVP